MTVKIQTENGQIELSNEVIAAVCGAATDNYLLLVRLAIKSATL